MKYDPLTSIDPILTITGLLTISSFRPLKAGIESFKKKSRIRNNEKKQRNDLRFVVGSVSVLGEKITEYTEIRFVFNSLLIVSTETR